MRISVIGCGYLGAVHAVCMVKLGHEVVAMDIDRERISNLSAGRVPFFEPGLAGLLESALTSGRLHFTSDAEDLRGAKVHFLAVGTPQNVDGYSADLTFVDAAVESLLPLLTPGDVVVGKSTVPVGTAQRLAGWVAAAQPEATLVWNPEFLREGFAVSDTLTPDRLVYGVPSGESGSYAAGVLDEVYAAAIARETPRIVTDYATSELVKVSANAFLATKISFINAMAEIAEATGADVTELADAIGLDSRIGRRFLNSGLGFGGGCLPKDIRAFRARAEELGLGSSLAFLSEVDAINLRRRDRMVDLTRETLGGSVAGKRLAILGLAFKPDSDDVRDSPALEVASRLSAEGAIISATDPQAIGTARSLFPELSYVDTPEAAAEGADAVLVLTEWQEFRSLTPDSLASVSSRVLLDGRNCLDRALWESEGWLYRSLGRPRS